MKKIVLFGSGDNSNVVLDIINEIKGYKIIGIVDKKKNISYKKNKLNYLGDIKYFFKKYNKSQKNLEGIITVGFNFSRKKIAQEINPEIFIV